MSALNSRNQLALGIATSGASILNGDTLHALAGDTCWLNDDTAIAQVNDASVDGQIVSRLWRWGIDAAGRIISGPDVLDSEGCNQLSASSGHYAAFLATSGLRWVFAGQPMQRDPKAGHATFDESGVMLYVSDYASGTGITVIWPDGHMAFLATGPITQQQLISASGAVLWKEGDTVHCADYGPGIIASEPPLTAVTPAYDVTPVLCGSDWWVAYHTAEEPPRALANHWGDASEGYILAIAPTFNLCAQGTADAITSGWGTTQAEAPGQGAIITVPLSQPMVPLTTPITIHATPGLLDHACEVGAFKLSGGSPMPFSSVLTNQQPYRRDLTIDLPWAASDSLPDVSQPIAGIYEEITPNYDPTWILAEAARRNCRIAVLTDGPQAPLVPAWLRPQDQVWLECYWWVNMSFRACQDAWIANAQDVRGRWAGDMQIVTMFYRRGGVPGDLSEQQSVDTAAAAINIVLPISPRFKGMMAFSYLRGNGITANPASLGKLWEQVVAQQQKASWVPVNQSSALAVMLAMGAL